MALGDAPVTDLSQRHIASMLRARPGHRAALQGFLSFVAAEGGPRLTIAKPRQIRSPEQRLRADIRACRKRLKSPRTVAEARALIASLIAKVYAIPLTRVLNLRRAEIAPGPTLWPDAEAIRLAEPLASAVSRWMVSTGDFAFPGRHGHQPLSETAVRYQLSLKSHLLDRRPVRLSSL